jgi:heterodisulfide reductase subunit A
MLAGLLHVFHQTSPAFDGCFAYGRHQPLLHNIRAFGKGFKEFYMQAKDIGANYVKGKIGSISEKENGNLILRYEDINTGKVTEKEHDLVSVVVGCWLIQKSQKCQKRKAELDALKYIKQPDLLQSPATTSIKVYLLPGQQLPRWIIRIPYVGWSAASETSGYLNQWS